MELAVHLIALFTILILITLLDTPLWLWSILTTGLLGGSGYASIVFGYAGWQIWLGVGTIVFAMRVPFVRQLWLSNGFYVLAKRVVPQMGDTERAAIEAGDVWWEGNLFQGKPNWKAFHALPKPTLTIEEESFIDNQVETLCGLLDDWTSSNKEKDISKAAWDYIKKERFFAMIIPKEYGGLGFSALANSTVVQKIATRSVAAAVTVMVPNSLGPAELLLHYGTEEQKRYYLPRLALAKEIPCFALTSPEAGSDATSIQDKGIVCRGIFEGKEVIGLKLTWEKRYITLAPVATVLGLAVKLYDPEGLLGGAEHLGITLCLVPTSHPGVQIGARHFPMYQTFMNGPTRGKDVFVPLEWIIGGQANIGQGWRFLCEALSIGRGIALPALAVAMGKMSYRMTGAYAKLRKQFQMPIGQFEGIEKVLARIAGYTYMLEAMRFLTTTGIDQGIKPSVVTAIAKYHMTEMARVTVNDAMDVHAGKGIMGGPRNYLSNAYLAIPIAITVEGANILTRNLIIFGQGAIRCHPFAQREMSALSESDPVVGLPAFDKVFFGHVRYFITRILKLFWITWTWGFFLSVPVWGATRGYYKKLTRMSVALAVVADVAMQVMGGKLKSAERLSARLGDVLSKLYTGSAVLKYYEDFGNEHKDLPYVQWCIQTCLVDIQEALYGFFDNFPNRWVAAILKRLVFPLGRVYKAPGDVLEHPMAAVMMTPSSFRDRITDYCYTTQNEHDCVGRVEFALAKLTFAKPGAVKLERAVQAKEISKAIPMMDKIRQAVVKGILSESEAQALEAYERARQDVIAVDEFSKEQWAVEFS